MMITIEVRDVYGLPKAYPVCERAKLFARLRKTSTLTAEALTLIHKLGYSITVTGRYSGTWLAGSTMPLVLEGVAA